MLGYLNSSNEIEGENVEFPFVSFEDIITATDNFSESKQIGRGGFGKVYRVTQSFVHKHMLCFLRLITLLDSCFNYFIIQDGVMM
jgi:hypothetical protein